MASKIPKILVSNVYKSRKNLLQIFESQDYITSDYENFSINEINIMFQNNQLDMLLEKKEDEVQNNKGELGLDENNTQNEKINKKNKLYIRYNLDKKLTESVITNLLDDLYNEDEPLLTSNDTLFIVIKEEVNDTMKRIMKQVWEKQGLFVIFESIHRLQYNILNHSLVPPHRIISKEEIQTLFQKYNITSSDNLPEISRFDPVAKLIGIRPKQICHILRPSKSAITSNYYRVCV